MIVQACLNGARPADYHPAIPLSAEAMARDAAACVQAGAGELHIHPRDYSGRESLAAVDAVVARVRTACPGSLIGVSTGAWIENDIERTRSLIGGWTKPDYASVNLSEADAPAVMALLRARGIGIEAGLASVSDAERFVGLADREPVLRILLEIDEQDRETAVDIAGRIADILLRKAVCRPLLLHGRDATTWDLVRLARKKGWSTRIGLEDTSTLPDGTPARDNSALVEAAREIYRQA
ncbi:3-keto-5-aminohexanoate cleavage protein [Rhizobium halophytocola]|uniref:Uncharacterized protein (DUF849 family) n=1 Tax=Rhizobium halophytocola TaxID=735519 RepID=A0ABS4DYN3_9HYPH|nr:3-keto-5-aminohexanoate cleavage protein [Rhizobium halophytocola]MBP1850797.1 uncharacterized protein (DUF849 family) [Rhizobium halophytocola]